MKTTIIISLVIVSLIIMGMNIDEKHITKIDFESRGLIWPLSVDEGYIGCDVKGSLQPIWFKVNDGTKYAVNGAAERLYEEIDPIWANNPRFEDLKLDIGDLIKEGIKACSE